MVVLQSRKRIANYISNEQLKPLAEKARLLPAGAVSIAALASSGNILCRHRVMSTKIGAPVHTNSEVREDRDSTPHS